MGHVLSVIVAAVAVFLGIKLLSTPIRWFWKLCINTLCGAVLLVLVNLFSGFTGVYIEITALNGCLVGFLGLPGLVLVLLMQIFF